MKELTPRKIAAALGGTFYGTEEAAGTEITAVCTDSRKIVPGCMFVPIRGERTDGHLYIDRAIADGALFTLTERQEDAGRVPCIVVPDTLRAVQETARFYFSHLPARVVAVTGSVGKTSTKEMIASVLSKHFRVLKTPGNYNNELGLPLTVFMIREEDEVAVLEMGISHFGEMDDLARIAPPEIAVYTNIGPCHLEFLGDLAGVLRAKGEMLAHLKPGGCVIANGEDRYLRTLRCPDGTEPVYYGTEGTEEIYADRIEADGAGTRCVVHFPGGEFPAEIPYPGAHYVLNALAACAVGWKMGLSTEEIREGIRSFVLPSGRLEEIEGEGGVRIINDCYNANPSSMKASLSVLCGTPGRKVAVLGNMAELGENGPQYHREIGAFASSLPLSAVVTVGDLAKGISDEILRSGAPVSVYHEDSTEAAAECLRGILQKGDTLLVKASRSMAFEKITEALRKKS